ncbi:MAG: 50S ribosomal protein L29 [Actinomycetota bacterium]|nr:50S ribosomal protein L29 [Actinomycetota bacterium]
MSKASELRELDSVELRERLDQDTKELFNLRFDLATSSVANTARVGLLKREIARINTLLNERERSAEGK